MSKKRSRKWDNWESIGDLFAEGGQGRLYLVKNTSEDSDEIYVLKELKNPKRIKRFEREIKAITNIKPHPNLIQLIDYGIYRDENRPCYVMPRADCSLDMYLPELNKDVNLSFETFELICAGAEHLHKAGIVHRDLKPENILMFSGKPKISDFGLCLVVDDTRFTSTPEAVGPRLYMAPELEDGKNLDVDPSADIYSLGKILYYILSGGIIFSREKYSQSKYSLSKLFNDPRYEIFSKVFRRSISIDKTYRYKNASELRQGFKEVVDEFFNHPRTKVFMKLGSFQTIVKEKYDSSSLRKLNQEEWKELVNCYRSWKLMPPIEFFELAAEKLSEKDIDDLVFLLLDNENNLGTENLIRISGIIMLKNNPEEMHFLVCHDYVERFLLFALENDLFDIFDAVARISLSTLRQHDQVISRLSKYFSKLTPEGKKNFLVASYQTEYGGKLELMNMLLDNNQLDDISFEAVIAGICSMNDKPTLKRIAAIGDKLENDDRLGAFVRGIVLGSPGETFDFLKNYGWKNPVIKILCSLMDKNDDDNNDSPEITQTLARAGAKVGKR